MIVTDSLRIAELSSLVYCSCFYSEKQAYPTQNSWFLPISLTNFLENHSQISIIRSSRTQMRSSLKKLFLKIAQYLQENICVGVSF